MNKVKSTWELVLEKKSRDTRHKGVTNTLTDDEITTIVATVDFFNDQTRQAGFDLKFARFRVFDFLAMAVMSDRIGTTATKVLVYSFLKVDGDIDAWIEDLRVTDYDIVNDWQNLELNK